MKFTEKYKPNDWKDIVGLDSVKKDLQHIETFEELLDLSPMFFLGQSGTGKTSVAIVLGTKFCGIDINQDIDGELKRFDASDYSNINTFFSDLEIWSKYSLVSEHFGKEVYGRIIFLDECDKIPEQYQKRLTHFFDKYKHIVYILASTLDNLMPDLKSRTQEFRFEEPETLELKKFYRNVSEKENLNITSDDIKEVLERCGKDIRQGLDYLQRIAKRSK